MESIDRKLSPLENLYCTLHQFGSHIVVNVAIVEGYISASIIQKALSLVYQRHPMLRVCIAQLKDGLLFQSHDQLTINFRVIERESATNWVEVAEQEIHTKFDLTHSLWRFILLQSPDNSSSELMFTYHHAIADGLSCLKFTHDLLSFYTQLAAGESISDVDSMPMLPAAEDLISEKLTVSRKIEYILKKLYQKIRPTHLMIENAAPVEQRRTRIVPRSLSPNLTEKLKNRCRNENTSIHGALCAAMLLGTAQVAFPETKVRLLCDSSVDLRRLCKPKLGNDRIGSLASRVEVIHSLDQHAEFWTLARECKATVEQAIRQKDPQERMLLLDWIQVNEAFLTKAFAEKMGRSGAIAISNRGQFPFTATYASLNLKAVYFAGSIHCIGACLWLGAVTCQDEMACSFAYAVPLLSDQTAALLIDSVMNQLQNACLS